MADTSGYAARERFLSVDVDGPGSFSRALARADKRLARDWSKQVRGLAREVRDDARARYRGRYRQRSGRSVKGITSTSRYGSGRVRLEKSRPWLTGQEWGGRATRFHPYGMAWSRGRHGTGTGTYIWPAALAATDRTTKVVTELIDDAIRDLRGR